MNDVVLLALLLAIQAAGGGIQIDSGQALIAVSGVVSAMASGIALLYRNQIADLRAEGRRKDELIDRLLNQLGTLADVQDKGLDVVERSRERGRLGR